jgi:2-(1,2-epoxy-1,2-dihydrophenyl)acetyl-CoA isomerase
MPDAPTPQQPQDADADRVLLDVSDGVARVRFNRPHALNAIDPPLADSFLEICRTLAARDDVRVVVLSGEGKGFMAGGDVAGMRAAMPRADAYIARLLDAVHPALALLAAMDAPVIASLHGPVAGAGASIAFAADLAIAADDVKISLAYTGIGATPDAASTWTLPRLIGLRRALEVAMLSGTCDAAEALRLGLVNRVVPRAALETETAALAQRLARGPTAAYGRIKRLMRDGFDRTMQAQMDAEREAFCETAHTADFAEGIAAFLDKRRPDFKGQ